jgi:tight adherence protein B
MTFKDELEIARIDRPAIQIAYMTAAGAVLAALVFGALTASPLVAVVVLAAVPLAVRAGIRQRLQRQRALFADQLPSHLQETAAAMRAGQSIVGGLTSVAEGASDPTRSEFKRVIADESLGVPLEQALGKVVRRMKSEDLDQAVLVAMLQRETGGNMAEVIDRVADTIRERADLQRIVRTLTAQGRLSRWVVTALPIGLLLTITLLNRDYLDPLYSTAGGHLMLVIGAVLIVAGSLVIRRIVNFKV